MCLNCVFFIYYLLQNAMTLFLEYLAGDTLKKSDEIMEEHLSRMQIKHERQYPSVCMCVCVTARLCANAVFLTPMFQKPHC